MMHNTEQSYHTVNYIKENDNELRTQAGQLRMAYADEGFFLGTL